MLVVLGDDLHSPAVISLFALAAILIFCSTGRFFPL